ncbi:probable G-protein coupled receptor Mth-like 3, partial [Temnothorax curvispinosus]|uniref:Probable G-protein coupled receptor Mth-like 3 n=1 Tax=Temnothorax curvispinosus TaxID=300111 RepID=A0A6J1RMM4_9HYME
MYSIYAWGSASILTVICVIMDFVPSVPKELIRPEIGVTKCWFNTNEARALYFYLPMSVTVVCNICLFISTALKIVRHKKDTAAHLRSSESRRHDDNKQWFNLYLKLFIVMGINWSMEIISWVFETNSPAYIWYLTDLTNTLQGLIIFIIFVWKEKI